MRFFASLRELVGKKVECIEFQESEEATVKMVLKRLCQLYGNVFIEYILDRKTGDVQSYLLWLVNGRSITVLDGLETRLTDGDVLAILPPVGGG